jgi:hypothetical protein
MRKTYSDMIPAERLADRIAQNREIDPRAKENRSAASRAEVGGRQKAVGDALDEFQRIRADRIAQDIEIRRRPQENQSAASRPVEVGGRQKAVGDALEEFQRIKKEHGIPRQAWFAARR